MIGTIPSHWYTQLSTASEGASNIMDIMSSKLISAECTIGYLEVAHIILNWRGAFECLSNKFPSQHKLVDLLLERLLV